MKTKETKVMQRVVLGTVAFALLASCGPTPTGNPQGSSPITWTTQGKPTGKMDVLYVQNARSVTLEKGTLVLRGVNSNTICFTDRPARLAGPPNRPTGQKSRRSR